MPELLEAGVADDAPFMVEGTVASAAGRERGGLSSIWIGGAVVAHDLGVVDSVAVNVMVSPGLMRRELVVAGRTLGETVLVAPTLPLLAYQLRVPPNGANSPPSTLTVTLLPGASSGRFRVTDGSIVVDGDAQTVLTTTPPLEWSIEQSPGRGLVARAEIPPSTEVPLSYTVLISAGEDVRVRTALRAGAHLAAHERRATSPPDSDFEVRSGHPTIDDAVGWAHSRVSTALHRAEQPSSIDELVVTGLGALAAADIDAAHEALTAAREIAAPGDPLPVLLAARITLTGGDTRPAERALEDVQAHPLEGDGLLRAESLRSLADAVAYAASDDVVARLREVASIRPAAGGGVKLPMAGQALVDPGDPTDLIAWLLASGGGREPTGRIPDPLAAWVASRQGNALEAWQLWRGTLDLGLGAHPHGRGSWDDAAATSGRAGAGLVIATLVHGILGWHPDAPMGRATFSPVLLGHLTKLDIEGLLVGDVRIDLAYRREGSTIRYALNPRSGKAPPLLVFSPLVPGPVQEVSMDGQAVEADAAVQDHGHRLSFQFALDRPREVLIRLAEGEPGPDSH